MVKALITGCCVIVWDEDFPKAFALHGPLLGRDGAVIWLFWVGIRTLEEAGPIHLMFKHVKSNICNMFKNSILHTAINF